jgi:hypothetical protein
MQSGCDMMTPCEIRQETAGLQQDDARSPDELLAALRQ